MPLRYLHSWGLILLTPPTPSPEPHLVLRVSSLLTDKYLLPIFHLGCIDQGRTTKSLHKASSHPSGTWVTIHRPLKSYLTYLLPGLQRRKTVMGKLRTFGLTLHLANDDECLCLGIWKPWLFFRQSPPRCVFFLLSSASIRPQGEDEFYSEGL